MRQIFDHSKVSDAGRVGEYYIDLLGESQLEELQENHRQQVELTGEQKRFWEERK